MMYLLVAIVAMSSIMFALKVFNIKGISIPQAIMTNYFMALAVTVVSNFSSLGDVVAAGSLGEVLRGGWWWMGVVAGTLYFASMDLMASSTRVVGVAVTTMSSRLSLVMPIVVAFLFLGENITIWEIAGTGLVVVSLFLIIYRRAPKTEVSAVERGSHGRLWAVAMPLLVFLAVGIIAVCMKSAQHIIRQSGNYERDYPVFEVLIFASALVGALLYYAVRPMRERRAGSGADNAARRADAAGSGGVFQFGWRSVAGGVCLGVFNYFVTLGIMHALQTLSTSTFYAVYNIGVVVLTSLVGTLVFRERLDARKLTGLAAAVAAIASLTLV